MTREEAWNRIDIIIATHETDDVYVCLTNEKDYDALRIAREILMQEPCEDAISRQAVLKYIEESEADLWHDSENELVRQDIKEFPPVTPQQNVGRWIIHIDDLFPAESTMECNKCHEHQPITIDDNYCPNCGAKMEEDKE